SAPANNRNSAKGCEMSTGTNPCRTVSPALSAMRILSWLPPCGHFLSVPTRPPLARQRLVGAICKPRRYLPRGYQQALPLALTKSSEQCSLLPFQVCQRATNQEGRCGSALPVPSTPSAPLAQSLCFSRASSL